MLREDMLGVLNSSDAIDCDSFSPDRFIESLRGLLRTYLNYSLDYSSVNMIFHYLFQSFFNEVFKENPEYYKIKRMSGGHESWPFEEYVNEKNHGLRRIRKEIFSLDGEIIQIEIKENRSGMLGDLHIFGGFLCCEVSFSPDVRAARMMDRMFKYFIFNEIEVRREDVLKMTNEYFKQQRERITGFWRSQEEFFNKFLNKEKSN